MFNNGQKSPKIGKNKNKNFHMFIIGSSWWEKIKVCILKNNPFITKFG
jgi:hypothetical protein